MKSIILASLLALIPVVAQAWTYETETDKMTGSKFRYASMSSQNSLRLEFPYAGINYAHLYVRRLGTGNTDVFFTIDKGQLLCNVYECPVRIRFDDKPPMSFTGTGPADHSSDTIFLSNPARFLAEAQKAKKILIQANIYQAGAPVLEFLPKDKLEWPPK